MAVCGHHRKERTHNHGASNRPISWAPQEGPIDFDASIRSVMPGKMTYKTDVQVPVAPHGTGNKDFSIRLPGHDYRQPRSDPRETQRIRKETKAAEAAATQAVLDATVPVVAATMKDGTRVDLVQREPKQKGYKPPPRWNPAHWYEAPHYDQVPLHKDEGETWNSMESHKVQGEIKGQDRLFRTVRRPEDVATPMSEKPGKKHPLHYDKDEYYPGRSLIDAVGEEPGNDFMVRPVNMPDFYNPPPMDADSVARMQRLRELVKQRYSGRPRLIGVFRACSLRKPGYVFPKDLRQVFDQMGIKVSDDECGMLIKAVDKDQKGAVSYEEFADLIYGPRVNVGGHKHEPQERHVRHVTKTLVDGLISNGQTLGKAFCELDPERRYEISKSQFANALGTACNHISQQAVDFLWASQFPGEEGGSLSNRAIDWRDFMSQLAHFSHDNRAPTPCVVQGRKRQYDLLQRTAPITGGYLEDVDLNRPDQNADDEVHIVADKLVHRTTDLPHKPRDAALLTEHFTEVIRSKAHRVERALPLQLPKARLKELLKDRESVHQDELVDMLTHEIEAPNLQQSLPPQEPLYSTQSTSNVGKADVMTLDPASLGAATRAASTDQAASYASSGYPPPGGLKLVRGDIEAYVATQKHNRDHEVDVQQLMDNIYRPPEEKKAIEYVMDGLNRSLRGNRPPRERPPNNEVPRYDNYWQARYVMEALADAIATVENSNGGKVKPSKMFKRMDHDNDGYLSISDLRSACERFKIPNTSADLHALFSLLDKEDKGSIDIGEFTRNYEVHQGSLLDAMQKPVKSVYHEGGIEFGGPVQEKIDAREQELVNAHIEQANRSSSVPDLGGELLSPSGSRQGLSATLPPRTGQSGQSAGSVRSQMSRTGASIASGGPGTPLIYETQVNMMSGRGRVSDVIRSRFSVWKPDKSELYTSLPKTRYGMTVYPDTRHVSEPSVPLCSYGMADSERFKTTNNTMSLFSAPDHRQPQAEDTIRKHAQREFRVERIRSRQRDFAERCWAANEAAQNFDEMKVARKALNLLNYERKCHMACA
mmetsp:Transcript_24213/g.43816  ORF Transcript_24213/g.43816 Transcript_24213/m.43816 type:complete len:1047 (+) Transcript_24213:120-3260(+)